jgi:hypothetical protein
MMVERFNNDIIFWLKIKINKPPIFFLTFSILYLDGQAWMRIHMIKL